MGIEIRNISKQFGAFTVLNQINLEVPTGQLVALLGPSGSGKTTLLRIIAGLEVPDQGSIYFHGNDTTFWDVRERKVGFVFQHYALFKQMTVFENIAFGLRVRRKDKRLTERQIREKVHSLLKLIQLETLAERYPWQLSGGQRQRVALARALAVEPQVMLLDEPFGALDAKVRKELRRWIRHLHDKIQLTSIFVTHDQDEALEVADRVVIMNEGKIEQIGTPEEVYDHPASLFVYTFLGNVNLFHRRITAAELGNPTVETVEQTCTNQVKTTYARPHELEIRRELNPMGISATISHIRTVGPTVRIELKRSDTGEFVEAEITRERFQELQLCRDESVYIEATNPIVF